MKVVFITPADDIRRSLTYRVGTFLYVRPNAITGPLILGRILKDAGHQVEVYEELSSRVDYAKFQDADVFCIYTMTPNAPRAYFLADQVHQKTSARVLIGGMHASVMPEEAAEHADQVVVGEAEAVILDVVEGRLTDKIVYADCIDDLDSIPLPDYSLLKTPCAEANVLTTRGCPFCCAFCTTSRMYHPFRKRSIESVMEELRYYKSLGFKYMNFEDDNFTADKERAKEICRQMIKEGLVFKGTFFFGRTDMAKDSELMELFEQAHLSCVLVGIESLNQESLDSIHKQQNVADIITFGKASVKHRIALIASIVLGIDTDSAADIQRSVEFAKSINAYTLQPAILTPYPGTETYEQYEREGRIITRDWSLYDMMNVTFIPKKMTPWELQEQFFIASKRFYSFFSSFKIFKAFGAGSGWRRLGLWLFVRLAIIGKRASARFQKDSYMYQLKHMKV